MTTSQLLKEQNAKIIDVRTPAEFMGGNVAGSINIPLNDLALKVDEIRALEPVILCCASGMRSSQAQRFLAQQGIQCANGGSWLDVNYLVNNA